MARRRPFRLNVPRLAQRLNPLFRRNSDWAEWGAVFREELEEGGLRGPDLEEALGDLKDEYDEGGLVLTQDNIDTIIGMVDYIVGVYSESEEIAEPGPVIIEEEPLPIPADVPAHLGDYRTALVGWIEDLRAEGLINIPRKKMRKNRSRRNRSRRNPFNVRDQTPLILYAARAGRLGEDISLLDDLRAARMLLAHAAELNVDTSQIMQIVRQIETEAQRQGYSFTPTPDPFGEPAEKDYLIVDPRGNTIETPQGRFDYYWSPGSAAFFVKFEDKMFGGAQAFFESIKAKGFQIREVSSGAGTSVFPEFQIALNGAPAVEDLLYNYELTEAALSFAAAAAEWARLMPDAYGAPPPEAGSQGAWLSPEDQAYLKKYYTLFGQSPFTRRDENGYMKLLGQMSDGVKSTIVEVLKRAQPALTQMTLYPYIVAEPSGGLGSIELRTEAPPVYSGLEKATQNAQSQAFKYEQSSRGVLLRFWIPNTKWITGVERGRGREGGTQYKALGKALDIGMVGVNKDIGSIPLSDKWTVRANLLTPQGREDAAANSGEKRGVRRGGSSEWGEKNWRDSTVTMGPETGLVTLCPYIFKFTSIAPHSVNRLADRMESLGLYALASMLRVVWGGLALEDTVCDDVGPLSGAVRIEETTFTNENGTREIPGIEVESRDNYSGSKEIAEKETDELRALAQSYQPPPNFKSLGKVAESDKIGAKLKTVEFRPYPYQEVGIAFAQMKKGRCLIGDEMGLGKTIQALGFLASNPSPSSGKPVLPALVICPSSVLGNWKNEVEAWLPHLTAGIYESKGGKAQVPNTDVVMVTHTTCGNETDRLINRFQTIIVDEAHYGKNLYAPGGSQKKGGKISVRQLMGLEPLGKVKPASIYTSRTLGIVRMCHSAPHALLLTGTPIENAGYSELWSQLYAIDPEAFPELKAFSREYEPKALNERPAGQTNAYYKLVKMLECYMVRRRKQDCADQTGLGELRLGFVPGFVPLKVGANKTIHYEMVENPESRAIYDEKSSDAGVMAVIINSIRRDRIDHVVRAVLQGQDCFAAIDAANKLDRDPEKSANTKLAVDNYLRQAVAEAKIPGAIEWIQRVVGREGHACVMWYEHKQTKAALEMILKSMQVRDAQGVIRPLTYGIIEGEIPHKLRTQYIAEFQRGDLDVIIGSRSMAEGVTLTRATQALFMEYWWLPGKMTQAEDRIYRVGQKRDCTITYLHLPNSIDDRMRGKLEEKRMRLDLMVGSDEYMEEDEIKKLQDKEAIKAAEKIMKRVKAQIAEWMQQDDRIDIEAVQAALTKKKAAYTTIYTLIPPYDQPSVLAEVVLLLKTPEEAEAIFGKIEGVRRGGAKQDVVVWLAAQGGSADRSLIKTHFDKKKIKAKKQGTNAIKALDQLTELGIILPPTQDPKLPFRATKKREVVAWLQKRGGPEDEENIRKAMGSSALSAAKDMVGSVLSTTTIQVAKCEPQAERSEVTGEISANPPRPEAKRKQMLALVRKRVNAAASSRTRTNRSRKQGSSLQSKYKALQKALSGSMTLAKADKALVAYNALHEAVKASGRQGSHVPESYRRLLDRAYSMISHHVG
jgi:hypothetical protein